MKVINHHLKVFKLLKSVVRTGNERDGGAVRCRVVLDVGNLHSVKSSQCSNNYFFQASGKLLDYIVFVHFDCGDMKLIYKSGLVNDMVTLTNVLKCEDNNQVSIQAIVTNSVEVLN